MTKEQYLFLLRCELEGQLPAEELEDTLRYYAEYLEEAGPEGEREAFVALGSPDRLARKILGQSDGAELPVAAERWGGTGGGRDTGTARVLLPSWAFIAVALTEGELTSGVWGGTILARGLGGVICILVGLGLFTGGWFLGGLAGKLYTAGGGLIIVAIGIVMVLGAALLIWGLVKLLKLLWERYVEGEGGQ